MLYIRGVAMKEAELKKRTKDFAKEIIIPHSKIEK
jgi:hypothetical protein